MILFQPLEEVLVDLEKACRERNLIAFNFESQKYDILVRELEANPKYKTAVGVLEVKSIKQYYAGRLEQMKRRLG